MEFRKNLLQKLKALPELDSHQQPLAFSNKKFIDRRRNTFQVDDELKILMKASDSIYQPIRLKFDSYID